jgi:hypothetical protein
VLLMSSEPQDTLVTRANACVDDTASNTCSNTPFEATRVPRNVVSFRNTVEASQDISAAPFADPSAASSATRRGSQSQPENVIMGDVYDPSLSEMRAWQQQPRFHKQTITEEPAMKGLEMQEDFSEQSVVHCNMECVICLEGVRSRMFRPCGHVCVCEKCCNSLMTLSTALCPMCRQPVTESQKIYL